ncbi:MAG: hypothetical protein M3454_03275 [Actinomycetota bacterium]|nr:hypothetical protein [Actinomycetota bacterium]
MSPLRDERGVIVDWLARTVLFLALLGLVLFDGASAAVNHLGLQGVADETAAAVSTDLTGSSRPTATQIAEEAAAMAEEHGARLLKAEMDSQGVVLIKMRRTATTLFLGRISAAKKWVRATAVARFDTRTP